MRIILLAICALICGCMTTTPVVQSTKSWENHYMTVTAFEAGTTNIVLDKNESIWVLSNTTLSRLLKNAAGEQRTQKK